MASVPTVDFLFKKSMVPTCPDFVQLMHDDIVSLFAYLARLQRTWQCMATSASVSFYCAMHFSAFARSWDRMSSVCPSVRLSVCDVGDL